MSLSQSTIQPQPVAQAAVTNSDASPMLAALVMTVFAAKLSHRQLRRLKRKATWMLLKAKLGSALGLRDSSLSTRTLLYILLGLAVLILAFVAPVAAIILLLVGVVYLLLNR